jgi:endonuclease/exonuclease/phosphatase family metal-dependent hydrolase
MIQYPYMKVCTLNIEGRRHLEERVLPFLKQENPDVVCLQEVFFADIPAIEFALEAKAHFAPMVDVETGIPSFDQPYGVLGLAILTRHPVRAVQHRYYSPAVAIDDLQEYLAPRLKDDDFSPKSVDIPFEIPKFTHPNSMWRVLSSVEVEVSGEWYRVANTHFTWSDDGQFTTKQAEDFRRFWANIEDLGEVILTGDFNSPRGGHGDGANPYDLLSDRMESVVPMEETTTLDPNLHRGGELHLVVDGIFLTPTYSAHKVTLAVGVSDHKPILAEVEKRKF